MNSIRWLALMVTASALLGLAALDTQAQTPAKAANPVGLEVGTTAPSFHAQRSGR